MKRKFYKTLLDWKNNTNNIKPLMLMGARQVGKTYIINEFCKSEFKNYVYLNLIENDEVVDLYNQRMNSDEKYENLKLLLQCNLDNEDTVLFIDEIQESEKLISELKYFCECHNSLRIIVAGSLLGVKLKRSHFSFPVGKVWIYYMYPMDFEEFLMALNREDLINEIKKSYKDNKAMVEPIHELCLKYYKQYIAIGGMPEAVNSFIETKCDFIKYDKLVIDNIIESYFNDMTKYVDSKSESIKIREIYKSLPSQLGNLSHKFQFSKIGNDTKSRDYLLSLDWLKASGMVSECYQVNKPEVPLRGFAKLDYFKLFLNDVGILVSSLNIELRDIILDNISLYKGIIAENYVANQLTANKHDLFYWVSSATAEVDFLITTDEGVIPVEVKASDNTKSKSLAQYIKTYNPKYAIRISTKNFGFVNGIKSVPLYAVFCIKERGEDL